ncbi:pseudoazurin [Inquilinus sp. Marseille-Q2685]|uniref:pseudoazurin n=1 Tax=Inquilinus sp. Marseille-Q2685 TaxID=2866581 RepID=UPI001CE41B9C|nr:pseudoazurin [Inquilinus sp. Marseille-Q2685]
MWGLRRLAAALAAAAVAFAAAAASGAEVSVEMLNKSGDRTYAYAPDLLRIQAGDSVTFLATDKGHNAVSIDGMLPDGASAIQVGINKQATVTFDRPGIYGIKCTPHVGLGMVAVIVVGDGGDLEAARGAAAKLPPKAKERVNALLGQIAG